LFADEAADRHRLVPFVHPGDGVGQVVPLIEDRRLLLRYVQAHPVPWRAGQAADAL
jgi:hypothetical protein